jgi:hypothetical protein
VVAGLNTAVRLRDPALRELALIIVAMIIFVIYVSTRGWPLDQDPLAYYFWLLIGLLFKLPYIETQLAGRAVAATGPRATVGGFPTPYPARR